MVIRSNREKLEKFGKRLATVLFLLENVSNIFLSLKEIETMKISFIAIALLLSTVCVSAQFDDRSFDFNRNSLNAAFGYHTPHLRSLSSRNYEIEYERHMLRRLSLSFVYRNHDSFSYGRQIKSNEKQLSLNFYPFSSNRKNLLKFGAAFHHSKNTISEFSPEGFQYLTFDQRPIFSDNDFGLTASMSYGYKITNSFSLGTKIYTQINQFGSKTGGVLIKGGIHF